MEGLKQVIFCVSIKYGHVPSESELRALAYSFSGPPRLTKKEIIDGIARYVKARATRVPRENPS